MSAPKYLILGLLLSLLGPASLRAEVPTVDPQRVVRIVGPIMGDMLPEIVPQIWGLATDGSGGPVDVLIDSPGGDVETGFLLLNIFDSVRGAGVILRCFVPSMAASMAFQLLVHCDERHTLDHSLLLWHRVRVYLGGPGGAAITAPMARDVAESLEKSDSLILGELVRALASMPPATVLHHFNRETLHVGAQLAVEAPGFIESHAYIPGLLEVALRPAPPAPSTAPEDRTRVPETENRKRVPAPAPKLGPGYPAFRPGSLIYMHPKWGR